MEQLFSLKRNLIISLSITIDDLRYQENIMIKGLAITPPILGRISIGRVIEKNGK